MTSAAPSRSNRRCYMMAGSWTESPVSTHFRALANELARRGNKVIYLVDKANREVENHGANPAVHSWPSPRPTHLRDALFLRKLIKQHRPDCLLSAFGSTNVMLSVGWWMGVPLRVVWYLTLADAIEIDGQIMHWKLKLLRLRKRLVFTRATHIIANSAAGSRDAQQVYGVPGEKCSVLYLSLPDPKGQLGQAATQHHADHAICVGRLDRTKGQDVLLQAIAQLKDRFPSAVFEFVGDGPCRQQCEQLAKQLEIADRCRFVGRLPHREVLCRMAASAISVVPSRSECFGLVNIESLAMGTPVVASDVGGIGEIFDDGEEGYLVPPDDPATLADRLATLLSDPKLREQMGHRARRRFEDFEQQRLIGRQVDWLESLAEDAQPPSEVEPR